MNKNKRLIIGLSLLIIGAITSGLFAIGNSTSYLAYTTALISGAKSHTTCGVLCFIFLAISVGGLVILLTELFNKKQN